MWMRGLIFVFLAAGFVILFVWLARESIIRNVLQRTYASMDGLARRRVQDNRKKLVLLQKQKGYLYHVERRMIYSGITRRFPVFTPELWLVCNITASAGVYFAVILLWGSWIWAGAGILALQIAGYILESIFRGRNYNAVNDNLLKFLDFLGNYSVTAGEVTGIFNQISRYVEEPLKSALDECYYEAQTSGDASLALLSMAEKIEHPCFKELVRNIEISARYSADFKVLVGNSRRAVREYLRTRQERKALYREALVNMFLLGGMSAVILITVEKLIDTSIWQILLHTLPGQSACTAVIWILVLFYRKMRKIDQ